MNLIDVAYALMALPTMISGFILAPKVLKETKAYFKRLKEEEAKIKGIERLNHRQGRMIKFV